MQNESGTGQSTFARGVSASAIPRAALNAFRDTLCLRDPRALSARPALLPITTSRGEHLLIKRDFQIRYEYLITPEQGDLFQEVTRDSNDIHRTMNVVSGAMTAAKMVLPVEILLPFVRIESARFRFRAPAFYGERMVSSIWWRSTGNAAEMSDSARLEITAYQRGQVVATGTIAGAIADYAQQPAIAESAADKSQLAAVEAFMRALGIDGQYYFEKEGYQDFTYPVSYVASLPSGEMVKQLKGNGGMIASLVFEMGDRGKIPIVSRKGPQVRLRLDRIKKAFRRVFTDIIDGVITHCRGLAVVNPMPEFPYLHE